MTVTGKDISARQAQLKRIGMGCNWQPQEWHLDLVAVMEPMAVYGTFGTVKRSRSGVGWLFSFTEPHKYAAAQQHRQALARAYGEVHFELNSGGAVKSDLIAGKKLQQDIARAELKRRNFKERNLHQ